MVYNWLMQDSVTSFSKTVRRLPAQVCAMCVVAVGSGLAISRWLGVDDVLMGIWLGALILSLSSFGSNLIAKRWLKKGTSRYGVLAVVLISLFALLYFTGTFDKSDRLWGVSKLLLGMGVGMAALLAGLATDKLLRRLKNDGGKPYFPFQKVVVPFVWELVVSFVVWFLTR